LYKNNDEENSKIIRLRNIMGGGGSKTNE